MSNCKHKVRQRHCHLCWEAYFEKKPFEIMRAKDLKDILQAYGINVHNFLTEQMWEILGSQIKK